MNLLQQFSSYYTIMPEFILCLHFQISRMLIIKILLLLFCFLSPHLKLTLITNINNKSFSSLKNKTKKLLLPFSLLAFLLTFAAPPPIIVCVYSGSKGVLMHVWTLHTLSDFLLFCIEEREVLQWGRGLQNRSGFHTT